jgi:hypothetical protein
MISNQFEQDRHVQARISRYQQEPKTWKQNQAARGDQPGAMSGIMTSVRATMHATLRKLHLETRSTLETIRADSAVCLPGEAC